MMHGNNMIGQAMTVLKKKKKHEANAVRVGTELGGH